MIVQFSRDDLVAGGRNDPAFFGGHPVGAKLGVGFGGGGVEFSNKKLGETRPYGGGNATGVKIDPIGFLVIKEGVVRMINVAPPASNTVDRIIDLVPQVMDRVDAFIEKQKN